VAILGIIAGALAAAFIVTAHDSTGVTERYSESHDEQIASAYLATDVQSNAQLTSSVCGSGLTPVISFQYADNSIASYVFGSSGGQTQLRRRYCPASGTPTDIPLVHNGGSTPTVTCTNPSGCAAGSQPSTVTISIPEHNSLIASNDFTFQLTGSRRAYMNPGDTTAVNRIALLTLGAGTTLTVTGGSLSTGSNGTMVIDSNSAGAVSTSGGTISAGGGMKIVMPGTCQGSGCPPTTSLSSRFPDPFAFVPQCPSASGCPSGANQGNKTLKSGDTLAPGIYTNVTVQASNVTFQSGVYVITGFLQFTSIPTNPLAGVSFYFGCSNYPTPCAAGGQTGGSFRFQGGGTLAMTPVTSGDLGAAGITLFMDRNDTGGTGTCDKTNGPSFTNGQTGISGAIYAASACVLLSGGGSISGGVIAKQIDVTGGTWNFGS
jgi:hypothetical protein